MSWKQNEVDYLINNYLNNSNKYLSKKLNKSLSSIRNKAHRLGLYKCEKFVDDARSKRNKERGRDLNFETISKEALKYKSRFQFQLNDPSAYRKAWKNNFLDDVCKHMISYVSIPQLICKFIFDDILKENGIYNDRSMINPYELDIYYPVFKIAVEYNGDRWHNIKDNTNEKIQKCKKLGITLIVINENSRKYEEDIKNQIIKKIKIINKLISNNIDEEYVLSIKIDEKIYDPILDMDYVKKVTKSYKSYNKFRKNEKKIHNKLSKLKLLSKYTKHMSRMRVKWDDEKILNVVSKYKYLNDLIKKDSGCYQYIKRNNLENMISHLI